MIIFGLKDGFGSFFDGLSCLRVTFHLPAGSFHDEFEIRLTDSLN